MFYMYTECILQSIKIFASGNRKKFKYKFLRHPNLNIISCIMTSGHESLEVCHESISDCLATGQRATLQSPGQILWNHVINANLWGHRRLNANLYFKCRTGHCLASVPLLPAVTERYVIETHCSKFRGSFATHANKQTLIKFPHVRQRTHTTPCFNTVWRPKMKKGILSSTCRCLQGFTLLRKMPNSSS